MSHTASQEPSRHISSLSIEPTSVSEPIVPPLDPSPPTASSSSISSLAAEEEEDNEDESFVIIERHNAIEAMAFFIAESLSKVTHYLLRL